jgi:hypothetical protein
MGVHNLVCGYCRGHTSSIRLVHGTNSSELSPICPHCVSTTLSSQYWCWIGANYPLERIFGEYLWFWITLFFSLLSYIPLYLCHRGIIAADDNSWWKFRMPSAQEAGLDRDRKWALSLVLCVCNLSFQLHDHISLRICILSSATPLAIPSSLSP